MLFLGGPLFFFRGLQERFCPDPAPFARECGFPVLGAVCRCDRNRHLQPRFWKKHIPMRVYPDKCGVPFSTTHYLKPLFANGQEHDEFVRRHSRANVPWRDIDDYTGDAYLGIDCGSTTTKLVLMSDSFRDRLPLLQLPTRATRSKSFGSSCKKSMRNVGTASIFATPFPPATAGFDSPCLPSGRRHCGDDCPL